MDAGVSGPSLASLPSPDPEVNEDDSMPGCQRCEELKIKLRRCQQYLCRKRCIKLIYKEKLQVKDVKTYQHFLSNSFGIFMPFF